MKFADKTAIRSKIMISPLGIESQTFPLWLFLYWPITLVMASQERRRFWMARSSAWMSAGILDSMDCTLVTKSGTDSCAASDIPITVDISNVKYHCRARVSDWLCLSPAVLLQGKIASWVPSRGMTHHSFPQKQPAHILAAGRSIISGMVKPFIQPVRRRRGNPNWGRPLPPLQLLLPSSKRKSDTWDSRSKHVPVQWRYGIGASGIRTGATYRNGCLRSGELRWSHTSVARRDPPIKPVPGWHSCELACADVEG